MRNLILITGVLAVIIVSGQTGSGSMMTSGYVNFFRSGYAQGNEVLPDTKYNYMNLNGGINVGYFVVSGLALGLQYDVRYNMQQSKQWGNSTETKDVRTTVDNIPGIFARYYLIPPPSKVGLFLNLGAGYLVRKGQDAITTEPRFTPDPPPMETRGSGYNINLSPGLVYFIKPTIGIEARLGSVGYSSVYSEDRISGQKIYHRQENYFTADFGISSIFLGASVYFGEKHKDESREK